MKDPSKTTTTRRTARLRGLAGFAGIAVACVVLATVTVLFGQASSMPWLPETPSNMAAMQRCEDVHGTAARQACARTVMAQVRGRDGGRRVAGHAPGSGAPPWPN